MSTGRLVAHLFLICLFSPLHAQDPVVKSILELNELTEEQARQHLPVVLSATLYYRDSSGRGFIEDEGAFIRADNLPEGSPGRLLSIRGRTNRDRWSNFLHVASAESMGTVGLVDPLEVEAKHLSLAEHNNRWVRSSATITYVRHTNQTTRFGAVSQGEQFELVRSHRLPYEDSLPLIGAAVSFEGNVAIDPEREDATGLCVFCPGERIKVVQKAAQPQTPVSVRTIDEIWNDKDAKSFRLAAQVVYVAPHSDFFVEHNGLAVWIDNPHRITVNSGDFIEVGGIRAEKKDGVSLTANSLTTFGAGELSPPESMTARDFAEVATSPRRIHLRGRVVSSDYDSGSGRIFVESGNKLVECRLTLDVAEFEALEVEAADGIEVSGIACKHEADSSDFLLYMPSPGALEVVSRKPPTNLQALLFGVAVLLALSLVWGRSLLSKLRRGRKDLRRLAAELKMSIDAIQDAILIVDRQGNVLHSSRRINEFFGVSLGPGDDASALAETLSSEPGAEKFVEHWRIYSGDEPRSLNHLSITLPRPYPESLEVMTSAVTDDGGEMIGRLWMFRDVTAREQLHQQLVHAQKQEAIGQLAGGFAHDFNNILTGISGSLDLATFDRTKTVEECIGPLTTALEASHRASSMVRRLLGFSRKSRLDLRPNDVNEIVRRAVDLLNPTFKGAVELSIDLAGKLPRVDVDATQIEQVILNICLNALDAIEDQGKITIRTELTATSNAHTGKDHSAREVCISISDDGSGMTEEVRERIFEPYYSTKIGSGVGLGLAMSDGIIKQHGGRIECESKTDWGTEFRIILPTGSDQSSLPAQTVSQSSGWRLKGKKILVVDDEEIVRNTVQQLLEVRGAKAVGSSGGVDAISYLEESRSGVDVVLLDWTMPIMSGRETLFRIRQVWPQLPVIVMSGFTFACDQWGLNDPTRPDAVIQKPFRIDQLCEVVHSLEG